MNTLELENANMLERKVEAKQGRLEELSYFAAIAFRSGDTELAEMFLNEKNSLSL